MSYSAGLVFNDGFEDGTTNKWAQDDFRDKCTVVSSALDGGSGPQTGTKMAQCNWNGTLAWNAASRFEVLYLTNWSYTTETFLRWWVRVDTDLAGGNGPKYFRIGLSNFGVTDSYSGLLPGGATLVLYGDNAQQIGTTFWGGGSSLRNGSWHKVELYLKEHSSTGTVRLWEDDVQLYQAIDINTDPGLTWARFFISSNWSGAEGCCDHDASNHIYWDEFEIYSDTGTGATGSMSDGDITVESIPFAPSVLTVGSLVQGAQF